MLSLLTNFPIVSFLGMKNSRAFLVRKIGVKKVIMSDLNLRITTNVLSALFIWTISHLYKRNLWKKLNSWNIIVKYRHFKIRKEKLRRFIYIFLVNKYYINLLKQNKTAVHETKFERKIVHEDAKMILQYLFCCIWIVQLRIN